MKPTRIGSTLTAVFMLALVTGCATDTLSKAENEDKDRPGFAETRAIAEEGFI